MRLENMQLMKHKIALQAAKVAKLFGFGAVLMLPCLQPQLGAQQATTQYAQPSWWFGVAGGANVNYYTGSTQRLTTTFMAPVPFEQGMGVGLYAAPLVEYRPSTSNWGLMLQAGYDGRSGTFARQYSPCNCPQDLSTKVAYLTLEPSLRFAPFKGHFYLFGGPRLGLNVRKSFTYQAFPNPLSANQTPSPEETGDLSSMRTLVASGQVGAGLDIPLSAQTARTQWVVSPFIAYQPYFGQSPRSIETWSMSTLRFGAAIKFGRGKALPEVMVPVEIKTVEVPEGDVYFTVKAPANIPVEWKVREIFPIRNYVFFNLGSSEIPDRYTLLKNSQVKDFKEDQLAMEAPRTNTGRSGRQLAVYYNILNILGDRMNKNPQTTINLVGSSEQGPEDGKAMAESVKKYLVDVFGIGPARIATSGRVKPENPSEKPGSTDDIALLKEGDRRVTIESSSSVLLQEFQGGPAAPLKAVEIKGVQQAPVESYVVFKVDGANKTLRSWKMEIKDEKGEVQYYGPYTQEVVRIPGKSILGKRPSAKLDVKMIGETKRGNTVEQNATVKMNLWTPTTTQEVTRFSVIYEFDESKADKLYTDYLTNVVAAKIPDGSTVIIHGYTDKIGDAGYNLELSEARANDVLGILHAALVKSGKNDVLFEVYSFGEDEDYSQFGNKYPEERFYNRTVEIDIVPQD